MRIRSANPKMLRRSYVIHSKGSDRIKSQGPHIGAHAETGRERGRGQGGPRQRRMHQSGGHQSLPLLRQVRQGTKLKRRLNWEGWD